MKRSQKLRDPILPAPTNAANAASWVNGPIATKSKATVTGLTSATKYYLRVAGIGAAGQGAFSELASQVAP